MLRLFSISLATDKWNQCCVCILTPLAVSGLILIFFFHCSFYCNTQLIIWVCSQQYSFQVSQRLLNYCVTKSGAPSSRLWWDFYDGQLHPNAWLLVAWVWHDSIRVDFVPFLKSLPLDLALLGNRDWWFELRLFWSPCSRCRHVRAKALIPQYWSAQDMSAFLMYKGSVWRDPCHTWSQKH